MDKLVTFSPVQQVPSAFLNTFQERAASLARNKGTWLGNKPWVRCPTGQTSLTVGPHRGIVVDGEIELNPGSAQTVSFNGAFSHTGWWFLYIRNDGTGDPELVWDDNPPDDEMVNNSTDSAQFYVCSVYVADHTAAAEVVVPFVKLGNTTMYRYTGITGAPAVSVAIVAIALLIGSATTSTARSPLVPPTAKTAIIDILVSNLTGIVADNAFLRPAGDPEWLTFGDDCPNDTKQSYRQYSIELGTSQQIEYKVITGTTLTLYNSGFVEQ